MLLSTFVAAGVARALVGLPILKTFWPLLAAVLLSEAVAAPVIILADAATQQAAEAAGSDYGRVRLFGAVGLGAFSPLNGLLVTRFGNGAGFLAGAAAWLSASCLTAMLPVSGLSAAAARGQRPAGRRAASEAGGGSSCCGGRLPLPLPAPAPAAERQQEEEEMSEVEEGDEEEEEEEEGLERGLGSASPGGGGAAPSASDSVADVEVEASVAARGGGGGGPEREGEATISAAAAEAAEGERATTSTTATTTTTTAQQLGPARPPLSLPSRFGGAATTRTRLSSHGGGGIGEEGGKSNSRIATFSGDDGGASDTAAAAAVAAAAAALSPSSSSPSPPLPRAAAAAAAAPGALAIPDSSFDGGRSRSRGSPSPAPSSSTNASSTRPLSPGAAFASSSGRGAVISRPSSLSGALALPPPRRRTSSSSSSFAIAPPDDASALPLHRKLAAVFGSPRAALFFATAWALGYGAGTIDSWLFVFLEEPPLRASKQLMGVTILVTCATEVPAFFYAGRLIEKFGSGKVLSVVVFVLVFRLCGYFALPSVTHSPWAVLPLETLNGVTFGCGWAAGTARAASLAPPGLAATAQAAFAAVYGGLGAGLGSLAGGVVRARAGGARRVFAAAAAVVALSWAATAVAEAFVGRAERRKRRRRSKVGGGGGVTVKTLQQQQKRKGFQRWPLANDGGDGEKRKSKIGALAA